MNVALDLTREEAEALLPWTNGRDKTAADWNRRADAADRAQRKIRAALREATAEAEPMPGQEGLL